MMEPPRRINAEADPQYRRRRWRGGVGSGAPFGCDDALPVDAYHPSPSSTGTIHHHRNRACRRRRRFGGGVTSRETNSHLRAPSTARTPPSFRGKKSLLLFVACLATMTTTTVRFASSFVTPLGRRFGAVRIPLPLVGSATTTRRTRTNRLFATTTTTASRGGSSSGGGGGNRKQQQSKGRGETTAGAAAPKSRGRKGSRGGGGSAGNSGGGKVLLKDLAAQLAADPTLFTSGGASGKKTNNKNRRTRKRVDAPKQSYLYASQRRKLAEKGLLPPKKKQRAVTADEEEGGEKGESSQQRAATAPAAKENDSLALARSLGLNPYAQRADPVVYTGTDTSSADHDSSSDDGAKTKQAEQDAAVVAIPSEDVPTIVGRIRVGDEDVDGFGSSYAYVVRKPVGWSVLGEKQDKKRKMKKRQKEQQQQLQHTQGAAEEELELLEDDYGEELWDDEEVERELHSSEESMGDGEDFEPIDESAILAVLTPEERAEWERDLGTSLSHLTLSREADLAAARAAERAVRDGVEDEEEIERLVDEARSQALESSSSASSTGDNSGGGGGMGSTTVKKKKQKKKKTPSSIRAKAAGGGSTKASFGTDWSRPSLSSYLKRTITASTGKTVRGGNHWRAVAGATAVDDTGLVLLCPRDRVDNLHVDAARYVAVVGNGQRLAPRTQLNKERLHNSGGGAKNREDEVPPTIDIVARLRKGRGDDPVQTVSVVMPDGPSNGADAVWVCQETLRDGIRGDPAGSPLDRRAARRLVHCDSMTVSSLSHDDDPLVVTAAPTTGGGAGGHHLPDDMAVYAGRRNGHGYRRGSFLGRSNGLGLNDATTAYREINGASDGFPGWIVDRYGPYLFVQHDQAKSSGGGGGDGGGGGQPRYGGPLPSLHDGYTRGVYYLPTKPDRSVMGKTNVRPALLEGSPAPHDDGEVAVVENGVQYHVRLGDSYSTGMFLDQRCQRAWLMRHCDGSTRLLNCFAHAGAFSVAAAVAGAATVSLDLDKGWLDRIQPQMRDNGVLDVEGRHDCIYGDCFDWLARLSKRGEEFDIVILDPPSTSVGKKKKRWSVKNDMAELVALAAPLVKSGGLLWTTTNSASVTPEKFARMCKKGLEDAGVLSAKLERVGPMPPDFPTLGPPPVKNLVWRFP